MLLGEGVVVMCLLCFCRYVSALFYVYACMYCFCFDLYVCLYVLLLLCFMYMLVGMCLLCFVCKFVCNFMYAVLWARGLLLGGVLLLALRYDQGEIIFA